MLAQAKVFIQSGPFNSFESITRKTFQQQGRYQIVNKLSDSDIVVWTGGEDISPHIYGEKPIKGTYFSAERDKDDLDAVKQALTGRKFLVGICRGAQLLNCVPNGGTLWQNVNHHHGQHKAFDNVTGKWLPGGVNSVHHQMMRPTEQAEIICWTIEADSKSSEHEQWDKINDAESMKLPESQRDVEALFYPATKSFCFQGHPEFGNHNTTKYFFGLLDKYYWGK